jgi:hypothetical protein
MLKKLFYTIIMLTSLTSFSSDFADAASAAGSVCALVEQPVFKKLCLHCDRIIEFRSKKVNNCTYAFNVSIDGTHQIVPLTVVPVRSSDVDISDLAARTASLSAK